MSGGLLLLVGLACIGLATSCGVLVVATDIRARREVEQSLNLATRSVVAGRPVAHAAVAHPRGLAQLVLRGSLRIARRVGGAEVAARTQQRLDLAGNPPAWNVDRVLATKTIAGVGLALFGLLIAHTHLTRAVLLAVVFAALGFFLPDVLLKNMALKRQEEIQRSLADCLDMLTISVEAGLGFDAALAQVAANTVGPVGAEFARVLQEMRIGRGRAEAFRSLQDRTTVPEFRSFIAAIVQADAFGIPIGNVLRAQSKEMRLKRRQRAEEKAQKVPLKIMVPVVFCVFPALFIVVLGPGVINAVHLLHHR